MQATNPRQPFHEEFAQKIIESLKSGTAPWQKPWSDGTEILPPYNPVSGAVYKGVNRINLSLANYDDPRWMTFKQARDHGLVVKKGSKATTIIFYQWSHEKDRVDDKGNTVLDDDGKPQKVAVSLERPILRFAHVFNGEQIAGLEPLQKDTKVWDDHAKAEKILLSSKAIIKHDQSKKAFYRPHTDSIHLCPKEAFDTPSKYYATALHELGHWTGHTNRLNRDFGPFGSPVYAMEELRAEISSWMLGQELSIGHDPEQHAAYVASWITALENDPSEIMRACRDAEQIKDYVLELEQSKDIGTEQASTQYAPIHEAATGLPIAQDLAQTKTFISVPYAEKEQAKSLGAEWDKEARSWFVPEGVDLLLFKPWRERPQEIVPTGLSPEAEFAERLREAGLILDGPPVMDGELHRVPVERNKSNKDGAYKGFLDGRPAGYFENLHSGEKGTWKYSGHQLSTEDMGKLKAETAQKREQAARDRKNQQELVALRCQEQWEDNTVLAQNDQTYLSKKSVEAFGVKTDPRGNLIIPGRDVGGHIQTLQTITPYGKFFAKGSAKTGAFHIIDPNKNFGQSPILIAEGYATAASIHMGTGKPVVCAFDAGNLLAVAQSLRTKYPDQSIIFMADNDQLHPENPGINKALQAAEAVQGIVSAPPFSPEEAQKGLTDWNDLHTTRGLKELTHQIQLIHLYDVVEKGIRDASNSLQMAQEKQDNAETDLSVLHEKIASRELFKDAMTKRQITPENAEEARENIAFMRAMLAEAPGAEEGMQREQELIKKINELDLVIASAKENISARIAERTALQASISTHIRQELVQDRNTLREQGASPTLVQSEKIIFSEKQKNRQKSSQDIGIDF